MRDSPTSVTARFDIDVVDQDEFLLDQWDLLIALGRQAHGCPRFAAACHDGEITEERCDGLTAACGKDRLAPPWIVDAAGDMLWALMSPELLDRLLRDRRWSRSSFGQHLGTMLHRTFVHDG